MKFKKIVLFLILFSGIIGCQCFTSGSAWNIEGFTFEILDKEGNIPVNGTIEGDSVKLLITFEADFVGNITNPLSGFMNSAYALTCEEPGDYGLENNIESLIVTSNSKFNDIPAGESLNNILQVNGSKSIEEWISKSKSWMFRYDNLGHLVLTDKPETSSVHIFTLEIEMESGVTIKQETKEVQWD